MAHELNDNFPIGGLNSDDEYRRVPKGDYLSAKNIRNAINNFNKGGALTNVKGNLEITKYTLPYNDNVFPTGKNRVIGSVEDPKYNTVIYFVWNQFGKHQILRYYRDNTSPANPYGEIEQIMQYDFGWTKRTRIESANIVYGTQEAGADSELTGDLLYWCDKIPKKINLTKANICTKIKSWNVYLPVTCNLAALPIVTFRDFNGGLIYQQGITLSDPTNRETIIADIAEQINLSNDTPVTAEACDCELQFFEKTAGTVWTIEWDIPQIITSPDNWYGGELVYEFFDRCKYPPLQAPRGTFEQDENYEPNYVQKKVFQFRLEYNCDDLERSVLGVWSQIPINNLGCDGTSNIAYNYIDVDFNDPTIPVATKLVLLKRIRFIARELNTGTDRAIIELYPCDFLDYDYTNNEWVCHYNFYNDQIPRTIDAVTAAKLFDNVPLETNDERFVKNRLNEGGILEGYDAPACIDAKIQMEFGDTPNPKLWKITGKIRVMTQGLMGSEYIDAQGNYFGTMQAGNGSIVSKYPFWESPFAFINNRVRRGGIFRNISVESDFAFFGGGSFGPSSTMENNFGILAGMQDTYDQRIPERGWPVYAAGTNYFTISRQINVGLPTDGDANALDISTAGAIETIGDYLFDNYTATGSPTNDLYSEFELLVPDGVYVIRLASHWCSFGDKLEKGFAYNLSAGDLWQKTSTNVQSVLNTSGALERTTEITVTVSGGDVYAGEFVVMDLAPPHDSDEAFGWRPLNGYLVSDENDSSDINDTAFTGEPVEKTIVTYARCGTDVFVGNGSYSPAYPTSFFNYNTGWQNSCITDHNGYFFGITGVCSKDTSEPAGFGYSFLNYIPISAYQCDTGSPSNVHKIRDEDTLLFLGSYSQYITKELDGVAYDGSATAGTAGDYIPQKLLHFFVAANVANSRDYSSTTIEGRIIDQNGNPLSQVNAVYENGKISTTSASGTYFIRAWSDMLTPNVGLFGSEISTFTPTSDANRTVDRIVFEGNLFCGITYPNGQFQVITIDPFGVNGTDTPPPYSPTAWYDAGDFEVNESNNPSVKARKRGGNYIDAIRCYDVAGRLCTVVFANETYIPFITEDIGKYQIEDFSGAVYPAGTFFYGKPSLKWVLSADTVFPSWVKTFQWMRTKNNIYGRYLQWVANQVTYLSAIAQGEIPEIQTSFQNADAVAIKISIKNVVDYAAQNPDSQIGYQYQAGDRLRLIADRTLVNYGRVVDFTITSFDSTDQSLIVKTEGFDQEILSGTLFEIFNAKSLATEDEQIFYETGEVINVTDGIPESYSGVFTNGDTYWRGRLITVNDEATKFAAAYPVVIEDASVSDFYPSLAQDIGRIGIIDPAFKQVYAPTKIRCSNQFIPSTAINGLSSFEELNQKEFGRENGDIQRVLKLNNTLLVVMSEREISNYIQVVTIQNAGDAGGVLSVTDQYFGTEYPHARRLGTDLPSSVLINDGVAFGFQSKRGQAWRYQGDGEVTISEAKMINYFYQLEIDGVSDATAVYHRKQAEYILTVWRDYKQSTIVKSIRPLIGLGVDIEIGFPENTEFPEIGSDLTIQYLSGGNWLNLTGEVTEIDEENLIVTIQAASEGSLIVGSTVSAQYSLPETISFYNGEIGNNKDRWITKYDFTPEKYEQLGSEIVMFKDGRLWLADVNPLYNNFFGVQYESAISTVFNDAPQINKVWNALWMEQFQEDSKCNWRADRIFNTNNQLSRLKAVNWKKQEQDWFIDFKRNLNDTTVTNPIVSGNVLRSSALVVELQNDFTGEITLYGWRCNWTPSARTVK